MTKAGRRGEDIWIDSVGGFIGAAWYWPRHGVPASTAVVLVPGIAHEQIPIHAGLVALAEALADAGLPALVMDLHGCSQSAGDLDDDDIGARWRADIQAAVAHARASGAARVIVVGVRLGVPLAAEALAGEPLAALVAWAPIASGRRYVRELTLLQRTGEAEAASADTIAVAGFHIPGSALACISALNLAGALAPNVPRMLLCDMAENLHALWTAHLGGQGVVLQELASDQTHDWLFNSAYPPDLPHADIRALTRWCRAVHDGEATAADSVPCRPADRRTVEFVHRGRRVRETLVEIGPDGLTGIFSEPAEADNGHAVRLVMSTVGPGRIFPDFARDEASRGNSSLRFDFAGIGTSGRGGGGQGGEIYTDSGGRDVQAAVAHLRQAGHPHVYGLGFCAGAWSMMQAGPVPELRAMAAINVALYYYPEADDAKPSKEKRRRRVRLSPALLRNPVLQGVAMRVRRTASKRSQPIEWLARLCDSDVRLLLTYAQQDAGLEYLNFQMDKGLREQLRHPFALRTYERLGHLAEGREARSRMLRDIADFFAGLDHEETGATAPIVQEIPPRPAPRWQSSAIARLMRLPALPAGRRADAGIGVDGTDGLRPGRSLL